MNEHDKLVTLTGVREPNEAHVLMTHLESEEIRCFLRNELSSNLYGLNSLGEATIEVLEKDLPAARQIMEEGDYGHPSVEIIEESVHSSWEKIKRKPFVYGSVRILLYLVILSMLASPIVWVVMRIKQLFF